MLPDNRDVVAARLRCDDDHELEWVTPDVRAPSRSWSLAFPGAGILKQTDTDPRSATSFHSPATTLDISFQPWAGVRLCSVLWLLLLIQHKHDGHVYASITICSCVVSPTSVISPRLRSAWFGLVDVPAGAVRSAWPCSAERRKRSQPGGQAPGKPGDTGSIPVDCTNEDGSVVERMICNHQVTGSNPVPSVRFSLER